MGGFVIGAPDIQKDPEYRGKKLRVVGESMSQRFQKISLGHRFLDDPEKFYHMYTYKIYKKIEPDRYRFPKRVNTTYTLPSGKLLTVFCGLFPVIGIVTGTESESLVRSMSR